jgi:hypothetical protein
MQHVHVPKRCGSISVCGGCDLGSAYWTSLRPRLYVDLKILGTIQGSHTLALPIESKVNLVCMDGVTADSVSWYFLWTRKGQIKQDHD